MYLEGLAEQFPALKNGHCKHILSKEMFYDVPRVVVPDYAVTRYTGVSTPTCRSGQITRPAAWIRASRAGPVSRRFEEARAERPKARSAARAVSRASRGLGLGHRPRRFAMKRLVLLSVAAFALIAAPVSGFDPSRISGSYVEARSADVYIGACFANSQLGLAGKEGTMAWKIAQGEFNGVSLAGQTVVAAIVGNSTIGDKFSNYLPMRSVLFYDTRATAAQREALRAFVTPPPARTSASSSAKRSRRSRSNRHAARAIRRRAITTGIPRRCRRASRSPPAISSGSRRATFFTAIICAPARNCSARRSPAAPATTFRSTCSRWRSAVRVSARRGASPTPAAASSPTSRSSRRRSNAADVSARARA